MIDIRSYMVRAWRDWMIDNGLTPFVVINCKADDVKVPKRHQQQQNLTLNINNTAVSDFSIGQKSLSFKARFGKDFQEVYVPILAIIGIFAKENKHGMWFNVQTELVNKPTNKENFTLSD